MLRTVEKNLSTGIEYSFGGVKESVDYTYNESMDNAPENAELTNGSSHQIIYDELGRKVTDSSHSGSAWVLISRYSYLDNASDSIKTSALASKINYNLSSIKDLEYEYDSRGNIVQIISGALTYAMEKGCNMRRTFSCHFRLQHKQTSQQNSE